MARRRIKKPGEFNPFIDILTCLAGVLILIIILVVIEAKDPKLLVPTPLMQEATGKTPVYVEVHAKGEFFLVPVAEMNVLAETKLKELTEQAGGDSVKLLGLLGQTQARGEHYRVDLNYILMGLLVLLPNPDAEGFKLGEEVIASSTGNWLTGLFDDIDADNQMVTFVVRANDTSYTAFKRARALAWERGLEVGYEVIDNREPIKFGLGGENSPIQG